MIFIIWGDYDRGTAIEEFEEEDIIGAEDKIAEIRQIIDREGGNGGTRLHTIIKGKKMDYEIIQAVAKVRLSF
jgi:hypothetical protein